MSSSLPRNEKTRTGRGGTLNYWISRNCTVSRVRPARMVGLTSSNATPHTASQLSLFVHKNSSLEETEVSGVLIGSQPMVLCIRKRPTKRFATLLAASTMKSMALDGVGSRIAAFNGCAARSSTKMDASTSTRCSPRQLTISTTLSLATPGMNSGIANSAAIKLKCRAARQTLLDMSANTCLRTATLISRPTSARGDRLSHRSG